MIPLKIKLGGIVLLVLLLSTTIIRSCSPSRPPIARDLHSILGQNMAAALDRHLGERKNVVLIVPTADFDMPLVEAEIRAFRSEASRRDIRIRGEEEIRLERNGPLDGLLTPDRYFAYAQRLPVRTVMVSFVGLGSFGPLEFERRTGSMPTLFVLSPNVDVPWTYLEKGLVELAIVPRLRDETGDKLAVPQSPEDQYRYQFETVTLKGGDS